MEFKNEEDADYSIKIMNMIRRLNGSGKEFEPEAFWEANQMQQVFTGQENQRGAESIALCFFVNRLAQISSLATWSLRCQGRFDA